MQVCAQRTPIVASRMKQHATLQEGRAMTKKVSRFAFLPLAIVLTVLVALRSDTAANAQSDDSNDVVAGARRSGGEFDRTITVSSHKVLDEGRRIFRYDTFGDEAFWGDTLRLHEAIAGSANGGVGPGVSPKTALAVGLKVDADALPRAVARGNQVRRDQSGRSGDDARAAAAERGRRRDGPLFARAGRSSRSASSARSVTRPSTIRSLPASVIASTAGRTATSTSARSSRCHPISRP